MGDMEIDWSSQAVLVTGGAGFIGSTIARSLLDRGAQVTCLDIDAGFERLSDLKEHPRLRLTVGDVRDDPLVEQLVRSASLVAHMASVVGVHRYIEDPLLVLDVSIMGGRNVLRQCLASDTPVLVASTSEVYGVNATRLHEDSARVHGSVETQRWCYATAKATVDQYAMAMRDRGLRFGIVRYFNVYGPTADAPGEGRVVSSFLGSIRDGLPLPLVDGGDAVRCFCYVDDAVDATVAFLAHLVSDGPAVGKVINVGRDEPVTMRELAERLVDLSAHAPGCVEVSGQKHFGVGFEEVQRRVPELTRMRELLGCAAQTSLDVGLERVLEHWNLLRSARAVPPTPPPVIPNIRPHLEPDFPLLMEIGDVLHSGLLTNHGPRAGRLQERIGSFLGGVPTLVTTSGSTALEIALTALGPLHGSAVLPAFTYVATLNAVVRAGLRPVFCDVDRETWTLSPRHLRELLASRDDASLVLPVNVFGVPPDLAQICRLAAEAGAPVVYDNAHGFGTEVGDHRYVEGPAITTFSFHATKVLATGEAGALATRDEELLARATKTRNHGLLSNSVDWVPGLNGKLTEVQAAIALHELGRVEDVLAARRRYHRRLVDSLGALGSSVCVVQRVPAGVRTNGQNLAVRFPWLRRERHAEFISAMASHGIGARAYFSPMLHRLVDDPSRCALPETEALEHELLCLPLHSCMTEGELATIERGVAGAVEQFM